MWTIAPSRWLEEFALFVAISVSMKTWFHSSTWLAAGRSANGAVTAEQPRTAAPTRTCDPMTRQLLRFIPAFFRFSPGREPALQSRAPTEASAQDASCRGDYKSLQATFVFLRNCSGGP